MRKGVPRHCLLSYTGLHVIPTINFAGHHLSLFPLSFRFLRLVRGRSSISLGSNLISSEIARILWNFIIHALRRRVNEAEFGKVVYIRKTICRDYFWDKSWNRIAKISHNIHNHTTFTTASNFHVRKGKDRYLELTLLTQLEILEMRGSNQANTDINHSDIPRCTCSSNLRFPLPGVLKC